MSGIKKKEEERKKKEFINKPRNKKKRARGREKLKDSKPLYQQTDFLLFSLCGFLFFFSVSLSLSFYFFSKDIYAP